MDLSDPVHLMFPYSGGPIYGGTVVGKHHETPYVSPEKMDLSIIYMDYHVNYHLITFSPTGTEPLSKEEPEEETHGKS